MPGHPTSDRSGERIVGAQIDPDHVVAFLADGRVIATPLVWYPRLLAATSEQRQNFRLSAYGIHWPDLDEDLSVGGMLRGVADMERSQESADVIPFPAADDVIRTGSLMPRATTDVSELDRAAMTAGSLANRWAREYIRERSISPGSPFPDWAFDRHFDEQIVNAVQTAHPTLPLTPTETIPTLKTKARSEAWHTWLSKLGEARKP